MTRPENTRMTVRSQIPFFPHFPRGHVVQSGYLVLILPFNSGSWDQICKTVPT